MPNSSSAPTRVGARVRGRLSEHRISQTAAAAAIGLSQPALNRRLGGEVPFDVKELECLASLLHCSIEDLVA